MATHPEAGNKSAGRDSGAPTDFSEKEGTPEQPAVSPMRKKLAVVGRYLLLSIAPVISIAALGVAVYSVMGGRSAVAQLNKSLAKIETLNTSLSATKSELEKLRTAMTHDRNIQEDERRKQDDRISKIIENITPLQIKLKIKPTLEDQLRQAGGVAAPSLPAVAVTAPTPSAAHAAPNVPTPAQAPPKMPAPANTHAAPEAHATSNTHSGSANATGKKTSSQVQALKEAIEQYNKK